MTRTRVGTHFPHGFPMRRGATHPRPQLPWALGGLTRGTQRPEFPRQAQVSVGPKRLPGSLESSGTPALARPRETDGAIASPWPVLHFLVLSGARVGLPVGCRSDGRLSLSRLLPGSPCGDGKGVLLVPFTNKAPPPTPPHPSIPLIILAMLLLFILFHFFTFLNVKCQNFFWFHPWSVIPKVPSVMFRLFWPKWLQPKQNLIVQAASPPDQCTLKTFSQDLLR